MLLFPINEKYEEYLKTLKFEKVPDSVYYMKQTISNACGTVAMIHSVANTMEQVNLDNGHLKDFLESTREKSPEERATELEGNAKICEVHDNIAREGQTAPVNCGSSSKETFLQDAAKQCKAYMDRDPDN